MDEATVWVRGRRLLMAPFLTAAPLSLNLRTFATWTSIVLFALGVVGTVAAARGWFRPVAFVLLVGVLAAAAGLVARGIRQGVRLGFDPADYVALGVAIVAALSAGSLQHEYAQGQMDIGFYINDAHTIATTGGRDLVGWDADSLLPGYKPSGEGSVRASIMFGYSALGAFFGLLGGYWAIPWVNAPLAFVTSLALYQVARHLAGPWAGIAGQAVYGLSFLTLWLSRWMMSENAATAAFWVAALAVLRLDHRWNARDATALILALTFGAVARPEGVFVAAFVLLVLGILRWRSVRHGWAAVAKGDPRRVATILAAGAAGVLILLVALLPQLPYAYLEANWANAQHLLQGRPVADAPDVPTEGPGPNWGDYALRYQWDSARAYGLHWFLLAAAVGIVAGLLDRRASLVLGLLCLPYFAFVLMPPVTTFHPWFMRRLWIAWIPLVVVAGSAALGHLLARGAKAFPQRWRRPGVGPVGRGAAAVALVGLALFTADQAQPFLTGREVDGSQAATDWILRTVPEDRCIVSDQDVVGYGIPSRFIGGREVVPFFNDLTNSFVQAFVASDASGPCFVLRFNTTLPVPVMGTDPDGIQGRQTLPINIRTAPRTNHRAYLQEPPLEEGYGPLRASLEREVPPPVLLTLSIRLELLEPHAPMVLLKGVELETGQWGRTPEGIRATQENASIRFLTDRFVPEIVNASALRADLAFAGGRGVAPTNRADAPLGVTRSGRVEVWSYRIGGALGEELRFPLGAVLRGVQVN